MILSFQNFIDCVLLIVKNCTISKQVNIKEITTITTATSEYLIISLLCDNHYLIKMWLGLSKNENTKNEKFYSICGSNCEVENTYSLSYGMGEIIINLLDRCFTALRSFVVGVTFLKEEVKQCLK